MECCLINKLSRDVYFRFVQHLGKSERPTRGLLLRQDRITIRFIAIDRTTTHD
jgi:hypothetical protein